MNQVHFSVGKAVEIDQHSCGAAEGGKRGGLDLPRSQVVHALVQLFDSAAQAVGQAFVGPGRGRRRLAAFRAPFPYFVGGGVGDAVAAVLLLSETLTGLSVLSEGFAGGLGHCLLHLFGRQVCPTVALSVGPVTARYSQTCHALNELPVPSRPTGLAVAVFALCL